MSLCLSGCTDTSKPDGTDPVDTPDDSDLPVDMDGDGVSAEEDCDDDNDAVFPGAPELCNGIDDDCDGGVDIDAVDAVERFVDADGDGAGDDAMTVLSCDGEGLVAVGGDCDDADETSYPGGREVCDGADHDCNGFIGLANPCSAGSCTLDVAITTATVSGSMLYNGSAIIDVFMVAKEWRLLFTDLDSGDVSSFDFEGAETYEVSLFPGRYQVAFELLVRESVLTPVVDQTVVEAELVVGGDTTFDIAVDTARLTGTVLYDDEIIEDYELFDTEWRLRLREQSTGALRTVNLQGGPTYAFDVFEGTYDVDFEVSSNRAVARAVDHATRVADGLQVSGETTFDIDVHTAALSGLVMYDGAQVADAHPISPEFGLEVVEVNTGEALLFEFDGSDTYEVYVYEGTYDLHFELYDEDAVARPVEGTVLAGEDLVVSAGTSHDIDVRTATLSGSLSYDGMPLLDNPFGPEALLHLQREDGQRVGVYIEGGDAFEIAAYEGSYDLLFELITIDAVQTPVLGQRAGIAQDVDIRGTGATVDIAVESAWAEGEVFMDGAPLTDATLRPEWRVAFQQPAYGESSWFTYEGGEAFGVRLYAGTYDLGFELLELEASSSPAPGQVVVERGVPVSDTTEVDLEVETVLLEGSLSYGGEELEDVSPWDTEWELVARNIETDEQVLLPLDGGVAYETRVYPGTYDLDFRLTAETAVGTVVLQRTRLGTCWTLQ